MASPGCLLSSAWTHVCDQRSVCDSMNASHMHWRLPVLPSQRHTHVVERWWWVLQELSTTKLNHGSDRRMASSASKSVGGVAEPERTIPSTTTTTGGGRMVGQHSTVRCWLGPAWCFHWQR